MKIKSENDCIAIIGMGCRLPSQINNINDYWNSLLVGKNVIGPIPDGRWENNWYKSKKLNAGFLSEVDTFDAKFFTISPREAKTIDPQQRLLLEVCWESLENSGITLTELNKDKVGVFIGLSSLEYSSFEKIEKLDGYSITGNSASLSSGRISYTFGFNGPSIRNRLSLP